MDRRSLAFVNDLCQSKNIESLMCFTCGQIYTHVRSWDQLWHPPRPQSSSAEYCSTPERKKKLSQWREEPENHFNNQAVGQIRFHKVRNSLFQLLVPKPWYTEKDEEHARDVYNKNLLKKVFMARFANEANGTAGPWRNASELEEGNLEWQRCLEVGGNIRNQALPKRRDEVLCCPEDVAPCAKCRGKKGTLCGECEVPICDKCLPAFTKKPEIIPLGLCNDNLWGYGCELIYRYRFRCLEAAIKFCGVLCRS